MKRIRLLLIEDNRLLREGITALVSKQPDFKMVAASENFKNVLPKAQKSKPQVVLLDICLRDQNSLRVAKMVKKELPEAKVIVMGLTLPRADVLQFVKAGASGFVQKEASFDDFLKTIRTIAGGTKVLPSTLTGSLFSQIVEDAARDGKVQLSDVRITKREREIIDLIGEGLSNKEIAQRLRLTIHTVKSHVHRILEKLLLHTRLQVAVYARGEGTSDT
ncbi:MAG: hypothetical protein A3C54_04685 [Deltaproteobacteria bacterium RIFCSPHIGHO2_02_FULL_60_17]|nr:MAG: hypothetical protein A3C54_04685 [Deltaproteobacteria bacterium RIFCSPHIGHO2_02_FULL_60_17]